MAYVRTVKTASGATAAVQIVHSSRRGSRDIEHIGSAHDDAELEALKAAARQRLAAEQPELDPGLADTAGRAGGGPLAEKAVAGKAAVKRNRFITLTGAAKTVNRQMEAKARALAGLKGYATNLDATAQFVIDSYHRLFQIEKSFRMSKHDLQARPIYHHKRDSIEAHLTIVFAALAASRWIEDRTGWSIRKFVRTARHYRTIEVQAGNHSLTAADPLPDDLRVALRNIRNAD